MKQFLPLLPQVLLLLVLAPGATGMQRVNSTIETLPLPDSATTADSQIIERLDDPDQKADYESISVAEFKSEYEIKDNIDPKALATLLLGNSEGEIDERIEVIVDYETEDKATVILTQSGLQDDSVAGFRHRVDMAKKEGHWQIVWSGLQRLCRHPELSWTKQRCP